jgi:hypothetical protein
MADELWPFLILLALLVLTGTLGTVIGAFGDVVHLLCPDPSSPFSVWWC